MSELITTALDFDYHSVTIAQVKKTTNGFILIKLATEMVAQVEEDMEAKGIKTAETILRLLNKNSIRVINLHTCIPMRFATIRCLQLPSLDEAEIEGISRFQAEKILPYPTEELIIRHQVLTSTQNSSRVMIVIVHQDIIKQHLSVLKKAGLEPERILLSSQATTNPYLYNQIGNPSLEAAIVNIGFSVTDISFISHGLLLFSRSVSTSGSTLLKGIQEEANIGLEEADKIIKRGDVSDYTIFGLWVKRLTDEIKMSLSVYAEELSDDKKVDKCIITGDVSNLKGLDKRLGEALGILVEMGNPLKLLNIEKGIQYKLSEEMPQLSTAIGLAVSENRGIDLLPEEVRKTQNKREKMVNLFLTLVFSFMLFILMTTIFVKQVMEKHIHLNHLEQRIKKTSEEAIKIEALGKRLLAINTQLRLDGSAMDILYELYRLIPRELSLCELIFEDNRLVVLRGEAEEMSIVFSLITILEDSPCFEDVKINYVTKRKVGEKEVVDFQINCPLVLVHRES
ncbi:type IV pilus assembly protein PilM [bacterium]|nr:type IV pilus assembly protein PilM [bacterium]